jgi:hypothetical protein
MQKHLQWRGLDTDSYESCRIRNNEQDLVIDSMIVGRENENKFRMSYVLTLSADWKVKELSLESLINHEEHSIRLQRNAAGHWSQNGAAMPQFAGVDYLDISLTPLTNSLPVNRLRLSINESAIIDVVYIDVLANTIRRVQQKYTRNDELSYQFENVPNDFEARITVDESGLVTQYPGLFGRMES